jgi:hypothetical protein
MIIILLLRLLTQLKFCHLSERSLLKVLFKIAENIHTALNVGQFLTNADFIAERNLISTINIVSLKTGGKMQVSLAVSICISVVTILLSQLTVTHDILLKDGRKIQVEDYWEEEGYICFEKYDTIVKLNKNKIKEIIFIDNEEMARRKKVAAQKKADMKKKYTTDGGVVLLNDGSTYEAKATWVEEGMIACKTKTTILYFKENEIREIVKAKIPDTPNLSKPKIRGKRYEDAPAADFMHKGRLYIFMGYTDYCAWTSDNKYRYTQWYKTENGKVYYWNPMYKKMQTGYVKKEKLTLTKPVEIEEPPERDFIRNGAKYRYLGKKKLYSKSSPYKVYKSENGQLWYWNNHRDKLEKVPRYLYHIANN